MTAFNPPSILFFNGVTFNPEIIEQGDTVSAVSGGGDVTLAGNNVFTGVNSFGNSTTALTVSYPDNSTSVATTAYVTTAIAAGPSGVSLSGNNVWTGPNSFLSPSTINVTTQTTGNSTTLAASTLFVANAIVAMRIANNTWTNLNTFNSASGIRTTLLGTVYTGGNINIGTNRGEANITLGVETLGVGQTNVKITSAALKPLRVNFIDSVDAITDLVIGAGSALVGIGETTIPTNVKGNLTVAGTLTTGVTNTIKLDSNSGLNRLLLSGNAGTSGYVLQSGGAAGSLSWVATSGISLSSNNIWTGDNDFSFGIQTPSINGITETITTLIIGNNTNNIAIGSNTSQTNIYGDTVIENLYTSFIEGNGGSIMIDSFGAGTDFGGILTAAGLRTNDIDRITSGILSIGANALTTGVTISKALIASSTLDVTGVLTSNSGLRTNDIDRITSGILAIGANALTTGVTISKALIASSTLDVTGLLTSTAGLRTNDIDRITSGILSIGANALTTGVTISKALIASLTLSVTGLLTATSGLRTNLIDRISSGSLAIGSNVLTTAVSIEKALTLSNPLILGSVATVSTELGYTESITLATSTVVAIITGSDTSLLNTSSLPAGIWSVSYGIKATGAVSAATITKFYSFLNSSTTIITGVNAFGPSGGADSFAAGTGQTDASVNNNGSVILKTTSATTFTLRYFMTCTTAVNFRQSGCYLTATRIG